MFIRLVHDKWNKIITKTTDKDDHCISGNAELILNNQMLTNKQQSKEMSVYLTAVMGDKKINKMNEIGYIYS